MVLGSLFLLVVTLFIKEVYSVNVVIFLFEIMCLFFLLVVDSFLAMDCLDIGLYLI